MPEYTFAPVDEVSMAAREDLDVYFMSPFLCCMLACCLQARPRMSVLPNICRNAAFSGLAIAGFVVLSTSGAIASEKVLHSFQGGGDGAYPNAGLIADSAGIFYGTTFRGGSGTDCQTGSAGCGTVFKLAPDGTETVLYSFLGGSDGADPSASLITDGAGNLYGTTELGGGANYGTVFKLAADGTETVLYAFKGGSDGEYPPGGLVADKKGNFYGTTAAGGSANCPNGGCGTVFEIMPDGTEIVLYTFLGGGDGEAPDAGLIMDKSGNLYGTTVEGGIDCDGASCGVIFKVTPGGVEDVLYSFQGGTDGYAPEAGLTMDAAGNLYDTTAAGGTAGNGTVFKLAPDGTETVLYSFRGGNDGWDPVAGVVMDKTGNLYGTTFSGGGKHCKRVGCGTIFKLAPDGTETVLSTLFGKHGVHPTASLLLGKHGLLYGTANAGGTDNDGVVFSVKE
jgi:uncharacterized repeat protein (TIGR03803 family)